MKKRKDKQPVRNKKPGPQEERVKVPGDWEDAVEDALKKERPPEGWPDRSKSEEDDED